MKKKEEIALEAITQLVHTIHMDWMSNLVAGLFNYKIVDVKETEEKNLWMKQFLDSLETISNEAQV